MMKSAKDRTYSDLAKPLNRATERRVLAQGEMRPDVIIIGATRCKNPTEMGFAKDDNVIETFPADRADQPLRMPVLPT